MPTDETVVETASDAAESVVFSRLDRDAIDDIDVTVAFENGRLEVDVYLNAPDERGVERVADDAALAAQSAVDDLFADEQ
jgi:hypothetical protein